MSSRLGLGLGLVAVVLLGGVFLLNGCNSDPPNVAAESSASNPVKSDNPGHNSENISTTKQSPGKFANWPQPALAVMLSGEQHGHLEPCGCTENQLGGLSRRGDLARYVTEELKWPLVGFDVGGSMRRNRRQSQIKFQTLLDALKDLKYQGLALGIAELQFGADFLLSQVTDPENPKAGVSFMAANVVLFETPELGTPVRWKLVEAGGRKIGLTAIVGQRLAETELLKRSNSDIRVEDPAAVLPAVLQKLDAEQPDLLVLLSHADLDESRQLANQFPQFDLIVSVGGPEDPDGKPETIGETMLVVTGRKGKYTGLVGFYPDEPKQKLRFELVKLDRSQLGDSARMIEHMRFYQGRLREEYVVQTESPIDHPSGATYVGVDKCAECHSQAYDVWKNTPHAKAFDSLDPVHKRHGYERLKGISRVYDAECLACHVTGWEPQEVLRYKTGFINEQFAQDAADKAAARLLKGNQCENCHGPGSRHVEMMEEYLETDNDKLRIEARKLMHLSLETAKSKLCYSCHDLDNSPHFEFDKYWEEVKHYGLD